MPSVPYAVSTLCLEVKKQVVVGATHRTDQQPCRSLSSCDAQVGHGPKIGYKPSRGYARLLRHHQSSLHGETDGRFLLSICGALKMQVTHTPCLLLTANLWYFKYLSTTRIRADHTWHPVKVKAHFLSSGTGNAELVAFGGANAWPCSELLNK